MKKILLVFAVMFAFVAFPTFAENAESNTEYTSIENFDAGLVAMNVGAGDMTVDSMATWDDNFTNKPKPGTCMACSTANPTDTGKTTENLVSSFNRSMRSTVLAVTGSGGFA
jgi:hypothetical protein